MRLLPAILLAGVCLTALPAAVQAAPLLPPRDLYGEATRVDRIRLNWRPGAEPTAGERYIVYRNGDRIGETFKTEIEDDWLQGSQLYDYKVRALNSAGESAETEIVRVATPAPEEYEAGPYLQRLTSTSVAIVWHTFEPEVTGLDLGGNGGSGTRIEHDSTLRRRHVASIKNLRPGVNYNYTWQSGGVIGTGSFRTPPARPRTFKFDVIGDFGTGSGPMYANLNRINKGDADFAITVGDNAQFNGSSTEYTDYVLQPLNEFLNSKPFWPAVGNHDYNGLNNYKRFFETPGERLYYRFRYGPVEFVELDSNNFGPQQLAWARRTFARSNAACKVAYFHHPIWSSGHGKNNRGRKRRQKLMIPLLQRGGVDLVLNGHIHNYERTKPMWNKRPSRKRGITYVVSGGGGAPLAGFSTRKPPKWSAARGIFFQRMRFDYARKQLIGKSIDSLGAIKDSFRVRCR